MKKIAIFASGSGTNAENIAKIFNAGSRIRVDVVLTNRKSAGVIKRMEPLGVETIYVPNSVWDNDPQQIVDTLRARGIDMVVLAGFMHFVSPVMVDAFRGRILNIHPSLLPAFGGKGMWGHHVHEAVIASGATESGVTVHQVTEEMDRGEIVMQARVKVYPFDTPESLEAKIHPVEYDLYPRAIVAAFDALDRAATAPVEESAAKPAEEPTPAQPTQEQAWAEALQIKFEPPVAPEGGAAVPPPFPGEETPAAPDTLQNAQGSYTPQSADQRPPMPPTNLLWAILSTVCCCLPLGVVAIIFASRVSSRYYRGDYAGAEKASRSAETWIIAAIVLGVIWGMLYLPFSVLSSI